MTLPEPLVPADVDLRDFEFMPLDVRRLRDSGLITERSAEEIVAAVLLWSASWHQVPSSSLPDDDKQLCQLAGYGRAVREFARIKDGAMHRFIRCSDGRWYHPVVAEKAAEGWNAKMKEAHKRACDRVRKSNKEHNTNDPLPRYPQALSVRLVAGIPCWRVWDSNGTCAHSGGTDDDSSGNYGDVVGKSRLKGSEGKLSEERSKALESTSPTRSGAGQQRLKNFSDSKPSGLTPEEQREIARRMVAGEKIEVKP